MPIRSQAKRRSLSGQSLLRGFSTGIHWVGRHATVAKRVAATLLVLSASGCSFSRPSGNHRDRQAMIQNDRDLIQQHREIVFGTSHPALPSGGFNTQVQPPATKVPASAIDPTKSIQPPVPKVVNEFQSVPTKTDMIQAWDRFQNPHLRILQETAIRTSVNTDEIVARLSESAEYGGLGLGNYPLQSSSDAQRMLLQRVAESFVDVRMYQQLLTDCYLHLKVQKDALSYAQKRKDDGKSGKLDVIALTSQIEFTESAMSPIRKELRNALKRMAVLTGQAMTPPKISALASQPQLVLPGLDDRLPATVLRERCDVRQAEQRIATLAVGQGVSEAALLPHLALEGELTAKYSDSSKKPDRNDQFGLNLGNDDTWRFVAPKGRSGRLSDFQSPLQQSMTGYQSAVMTAASDVETLLTDYHVTLHEVRTLESAVNNSREAMTLVLQQFSADRTDGNVVASTIKRMFDVGQSLPRARARLAAIAIELFKAIGGECNLDTMPSATFYQRLDQKRQ